MDTSGFYKIDNEELLFAPNAVYNKDYTLLRDEQSNYTYPTDGQWYWFDSREEACEALGYSDTSTAE